MNTILLVLKYWLLKVFPRVLWNALPIPILKDKSWEIIVTLLIGLVATGGFSSNFGVNLETLALFVFITFVVRLVWFWILIPARMYSDSGGFVENPISVEIASYPKLSKTDDMWVGINVINLAQAANIEQCRVTLNEFQNIESEKPIQFNAPFRFIWSAIGITNDQNVPLEMSIQFNEPRACDIARTFADGLVTKATFTTTFGSGSEPLVIQPGQYRLKVIILGNWRNAPISRSYQLDLCFQTPHSLSIDRVMEIAQTTARISTG